VNRSVPARPHVVYPGTFDPPTVAHLAIVEAVLATYRPAAMDLTLSRRPILKEHVERPRLDHRIEVVAASVAHLDVVSVAVTDQRLIADIAAGYDLVVMGADKWHQINDIVFYDDEAHRRQCLDALPAVVVVGRGDDPLPDTGAHHLHVDMHTVSSTRARQGDRAVMTAAARAFDDETGAWSDPARYDAWIAARPL
jgi:nicotinic acid mononucleotide adenylyltransferase